MSASIYAIATMDTKGSELQYVADRIRESGGIVRTIDVGTQNPPTVAPDIKREQVLGARNIPSGGDRGQAISLMSEALRDWLARECKQNRVAAVIGIGGSGGTALVTAAMRALPVGLPKLMLSTVASGNVAPYVDCSDIAMMYSVVDVAGLNSVSKRILANAAHAIAGMAKSLPNIDHDQRTVGMTMFGVTTPCVTTARQQLESQGFDCLVFHATGTGGRAMEKLVQSGMITGVLDVTTTEVADEIVGGVMPAGPHRFEAVIDAGVPFVLSLGALDMVNFGSMDSVPEEFRERNLVSHNPQVTLMRTTPEENREFAQWIASKLNQAKTPWTVLVPEGGVSALDAPGQAFHDPVADQALFDELEYQLANDQQHRLVRLPNHINDPSFATALVEHFLILQPNGPQKLSD